MEEDLEQALIENNNDDADDENMDLVRSSDHYESNREHKDSISAEDLKEIMNESSSSALEIDFSDDEDETKKSIEVLTTDAKI